LRAAQSLLEVLRDELRQPAARKLQQRQLRRLQCAMDGRLVNSCLVLGVETQGRTGHYCRRPGQIRKVCIRWQKFLENAALQCGICSWLLVAARRCWIKTPNRPRSKCGISWPGIYAAAQGMTDCRVSCAAGRLGVDACLEVDPSFVTCYCARRSAACKNSRKFGTSLGL